MRQAKTGFTLAELLIALVLLGVIAAFTIPKILNASGTAKNVAKVKEAVSTMEQAWYNVKLQNQICTGGNLVTNCTANGDASGKAYLYDELVGNPANSAGFNAIAYGAGTPAAPSGCAAYPGYVQFANGIIIAGLEAGTDIPTTGFATDPAGGAVNTELCIDTDPAAASHTDGQNVFYGNFNPTGNFGTGFTAGVNNKNFFWGSSAASSLYPAAGGAGVAPSVGAANSAAGTILFQ